MAFGSLLSEGMAPLLHPVAQAAQASLVVAAVLLTLCLAWLIVTIVHRIYFHPLAAFPGPKLYAVADVTSDWMSCVRGTWIHQVRDLHAGYGPVVRVGTNHLVLDGSIGWPALAHKSNNNNNNNNKSRAEFGKQPGFYFPGERDPSILSSDAEMHRHQRRQLSHAFSDAALNEQEALIMSYVDLLVRQLAERTARTGGTRDSSSSSVNIVEWLNFTTFDIIGDLAISTPFESLAAGAYHEWIANFLQGVQGGSAQRFKRFYPLLAPLVRFFNRRDENSDIDIRQFQMTVGMIQSRMALGEQGKKEKGDQHRDFMTYMLRHNRDGEDGMSAMEIMANAPVLIAAGSETTATALAGLFYFLGTTPKVYRRLVDEIRCAFSCEEDISLRSLAKLEYLQATLEETLRLYPPVAELPRRICPGAEIEGKWVPKGTVISIHPYATFRNPAHFADPDSFSPERFLPASHPLHDAARFGRDDRAVFKPFSFGSRDCIGKNLAFAEMRAVVARLLFRFDVVMEPGQDDWMAKQHTYILWHKGPLQVRLIPRDL